MAVHRRKCTVSLVDALSSEVVRKLRLACEAETKEDRDIVLEEVFCDVTSNLDETAQAQLGARGPQHFYAILARHYASPRGTDSAVAVLHLLQGLYGQGYAAPLLALLLHRWLLLRRVPGRGLPEEQRLRLANVLALGSAQLFLGDVHGGAKAFLPLWECLCYEVVLGQADPQAEASLTLGTVTGAGNAVPAPAKGKHSVTHSKAGGPAVVHPLDAQHNLDMGLKHPGASDQEALNGPLTALPAPGPDPGRPTSTLAVSPPPTASGLAALPSTARTGLLAAVAAPLVCYADPKRLEELLQLFPPPTAMPATQSPFAPRNLPPPIPEDASGGKPSQAARNMGVEPFSRPPLVSSPGEGVDFIMAEVVDMLSRIRSELGLIHYLNAMLALRAQPALSQPPGMRPVTRLRLQSQLYALTWSGGPHYAPKAVRTAALRVLDALYPSGRTTRGIVRALFRLLHPSDLFNDLALVTSWWMRDVVGKLLLGFFWLIYSLVVWGPTSKGRMEGSDMGEQPGRSSVWAGRDRSSGPGTPQAVQMQELVRNSPRGSSTAPSQAAEGGAQARDGGGGEVGGHKHSEGQAVGSVEGHKHSQGQALAESQEQWDPPGAQVQISSTSEQQGMSTLPAPSQPSAPAASGSEPVPVLQRPPPTPAPPGMVQSILQTAGSPPGAHANGNGSSWVVQGSDWVSALLPAAVGNLLRSSPDQASRQKPCLKTSGRSHREVEGRG